MISFGQTQMSFPSYEQNPVNFFWRFSQENSNEKAQLSAFSALSSSESEEEEQPDLNLCLSLGGLYAKPAKEKALARSSSIAGEEPETHRGETPFLSLSRSCSLPTETNNGEEMAKLRDLQSMRRMEAKRRLAGKQRSFRDALGEKRSPEKSPENLPASEIAAWAAVSAAKSAALSRAICKIKGQEFSTTARDNTGLKDAAAAEPPAMFSARISANGDQFFKPVETKLQQNPLKKVKASSSGEVLDNWRDVVNRMPSVTTTGDGPNGKRINGFLYKYTKGQVSIVCVCHGSFLSPAEFIKHAGGTEVANPMRHINVCAALPL